MTANELTTATRNLMNECGYTVWRSNSGYGKANVKLSPPGTPDLIGYDRHGCFIGVEIKAGNDSMRETQVVWHEKLNSTIYGRAYIVKNIDDVRRIVANESGRNQRY